MTTVADVLATAWQRHQAGALAEAEQLYRQVVTADNGQAGAWHLLGAAVHQQGRHLEAIELIGRALAIEPENVSYLSNYGAAQGAAGLSAEGEATFRRVLAIQPADAQTWYNLAVVLVALGKSQEAIDAYQRALALNPHLVQALFNLANLLRDLGCADDAIRFYRQALDLHPDYFGAYNNLGALLQSKGRWDEAIEVLHQVLRLRPDYALAKINLGAALRGLGQAQEAIEILQQVIAERPDIAEAHNNLGVARMYQGQLETALACFDSAVAIDSKYAEAHKNRAITRLFQGDFERGWPEFEWRWKSKDYGRNPYPQADWDGAPLAGTLLLHAEQGLGDTIQFVRFAAEARRRAGRVIVVCQPPLVALLSECAGLDTVLPQGAELPPVDAQAALMSLPGVLRVTAPELAKPVPYLRPRADLKEIWQERLASLEGLRVGIAWQGNPAFRDDQFRSVPLEDFAPLAQLAGVRLISLQKGFGIEQLATWGERLQIIDLGSQLDQDTGPFMDTAAIMANLDLVVCSDSAVAHLAGALGVPVWLAVAQSPEWRWMLAREDSPWYPSMRLFRQPAVRDWANVFQRMAQELAQLVGKKTNLNAR